jgi:OFA family oxalate/formate antiporter-like MFS transporter
MRGRWVYLVVGFVINICLGTVYSWSVFRPPLHRDPFNMSQAESILPFSVFLLCFGLMFSISGVAVMKYGPKKPALVGAVLVGIGYLTSSLISIAPGSSLSILLLGFGVVAGTGCAFAYNPPIAVSGRWFPDKRGFALGLTVMGFGLSSLFTAPFVAMLVNALGVFNTFLVLGFAFLALLTLAGAMLRFPPEGWDMSTRVKQTALRQEIELSTREMLRTTTFFLVWIVYLVGAGAGLSTIGYAKQIATDVAHMPDNVATLVVSLLSVSNAFGRPLLGKLADVIGSKRTLIVTLVVQLVSLLVLMPRAYHPILMVLGIVLLGMTFGAYLAVMPALISYFYGTKYLSQNYGLCFSAYGVGGVVMPMVFSSLIGQGPNYTIDDYSRAFYGMGALVVISLVLAILIRPTGKQGAKNSR